METLFAYSWGGVAWLRSHTGKLRQEYSRMLHHIFESRQEADCKEFVEIFAQDAVVWAQVAEEFMMGIKRLINQNFNE
jgi:uncharacterized protein (UPF0332 family)